MRMDERPHILVRALILASIPLVRRSDTLEVASAYASHEGRPLGVRKCQDRPLGIFSVADGEPFAVASDLHAGGIVTETTPVPDRCRRGRQVLPTSRSGDTQ